MAAAASFLLLVIASPAAEAATKVPGTKLVRYFKVEITSVGGVGSDYVGNENAVAYRGTQTASWGWTTREIYEYREFRADDPILFRACYGGKISTCSPTKLKLAISEDVDMVEDPDTPQNATAHTRSCRRTLPTTQPGESLSWTEQGRSHKSAAVMRLDLHRTGSDGFPWPPLLELDIRSQIPLSFQSPECAGGVPYHWIGDLEYMSEGEPAAVCFISGTDFGLYELDWLSANSAFHRQDMFAPRAKKFRKSNDGFSETSACSASLPIEHESYASREHTTEWSANWKVRFIPLKESKLKRAIKGLRNLG